MAESQPAQDPESESLADESQPGSEEAASMAAFQPVSAEIAVPASVKSSHTAARTIFWVIATEMALSPVRAAMDQNKAL